MTFAYCFVRSRAKGFVNGGGGDRGSRLPLMAVTIEKVDGGYVARVTPPHGDGQPWASDRPQSAEALASELLARGCHQTDIGDAFFDADPGWLSKS